MLQLKCLVVHLLPQLIEHWFNDWD